MAAAEAAEKPEGSAASSGNVSVCLENMDFTGLLCDLRNEYDQIKKAETHMQRQRTKWLRSVDQWLRSQEQVVDKGGDKKGRRRPALSRMGKDDAGNIVYAPPESLWPTGSRQPCGPPQPASDFEECASPEGFEGPARVSKGLEEELSVELVDSNKVGTDGLQPVAPMPTSPPQGDGVEFVVPSASRSKTITVVHGPEAVQEGARISEKADALATPARKRLRSQSRREASKRSTVPSHGIKLSVIVGHPLFDSTCACMILFNSVIIGVGVEHMTGSDDETQFNVVSGHVCSGFFLIELILRMVVQGRTYFTNENRNWNIFDTVLVGFSVVEFFMQIANPDGETSSVGSGMKTIKMMRIVRVFRVFRFFRELSLLALMIVDSMKSLMWALLMLAIIIYVFAILFTSRATEWMKAQDEAEHVAALSEVHRQFGSLSKTVYSLVQAMLGGVSWGVCSDALMVIDWFTGALFFFYVAFTMLAVMNIITGVFVDNAVETARTQRDFLIQKEMELKEKYTGEMRDLFGEMDKDGSGTVCLVEIQAYLEDPRVQGYFTALGLDPNDTERLFTLIDDDGSGDVDVGEFLEGCLRLKGQARSIDVYAIMHDLKILENKFDDCIDLLKDMPDAPLSHHPRPLEHEPRPPPQVVTVTTTATAMVA